MSLLIITDDKLKKGPGGRVTANLASTRLRLLCALYGFERVGRPAWIAQSPDLDRLLETPAFGATKTVLFGKVFRDYTPLVEAARKTGKSIIIDISDDLDDFEEFAHMRDIAAVADAITVPSAEMARRAVIWTRTGCPAYTIEDPFDGPTAEPQAEFGGDHPLELLWFGSPANAGYLNRHLKGLIELAQSRPLRLTLVSKDPEQFQALLTNRPDQPEQRFRTRFVTWSEQAQAEALDAADLVLLPGEPEGRSATKSANRLVTTIAAGRLAIASPLPAYRPLEQSALLVDDMATGIRAALSVSSARIRLRLNAGQAVLKQFYSPSTLGARWVSTIGQIAALPKAA